MILNMKNLLLPISLILNIGVIGLLFKQVDAGPGRLAETPGVEISMSNTPVSAGFRVVSATNQQAFQWSQLESTDYKIYIGNLRRIGCPEDIIRDLIRAEINRLYEPKYAALRPRREKDFWSLRGSKVFASGRDEMRQMARLREEQRELLLELLGPDPASKSGSAAESEVLGQTYQFLPKEKQSQVGEVLKSFSHQEEEISSRNHGLLTSADRANLAVLESERNQQLAAILSPEELELYELHNSTLAEKLRGDLMAFKPEEKEFRELYRIMKDAGANQDATTNPEVQNKRKAALGTERFEEYQRSQDLSYRGMVDFADRFELPAGTAGKMYEIKTLAEAQAARLAQDIDTPREKQQAMLEATRQETEKALQAIMGINAYQVYQEFGGYWLKTLPSGKSSKITMITFPGVGVPGK